MRSVGRGCAKNSCRGLLLLFLFEVHHKRRFPWQTLTDTISYFRNTCLSMSSEADVDMAVAKMVKLQ